MMIDQFFSNADYYKNDEFQRLMRLWNTVESKTNDPEILKELYVIVKFDFWKSANAWFHESNTYGADDWKHGLE